jgi:4-diphosphocytidyl-2-C-methyl-D-erythritol kinase
VFVPLALCDDVSVAVGGPPGVTLALRGDAAEGVPADARNLAWRAAEAFAAEAGLGAGVAIDLVKRVPSPAGLGGGSSDAGAVLRGLAALAPGVVPAPRLAELALRLGADVPYFLQPTPALVAGIGERILPLAGLPALPVLLAHPGVGLETRAVYGAFDAAGSLTGPLAPSNLRALLALQEKADAAEAHWPSSKERLGELVVNDLEPAASRLSSRVTELREELSATGARAVGMSGSGPAMYAIYASESEAQRARVRVCGAGVRTWLTRTIASDVAHRNNAEESQRASE